jgi:flavin reductase (DIM6/NTAB) family NADH-FMN oxidoreductase RutF
MGTRSFDRFVDGLDHPMFVVTAARADTGERSGCLVGFASQCSIHPERFLVCLSNANHTHGVALASPVLAVHALDAGQRELAALFGELTGDRTDKFARCRWVPGPEGVPLLADCPRRFTGKVLRRVDLGDHTGFVLEPVGPEPGEEPRGGDPRGPGALMFSDVRDLDAGHPA